MGRVNATCNPQSEYIPVGTGQVILGLSVLSLTNRNILCGVSTTYTGRVNKVHDFPSSGVTPPKESTTTAVVPEPLCGEADYVRTGELQPWYGFPEL
jgi:hypothetical protein